MSTAAAKRGMSAKPPRVCCASVTRKYDSTALGQSFTTASLNAASASASSRSRRRRSPIAGCGRVSPNRKPGAAGLCFRYGGHFVLRNRNWWATLDSNQ